MAKPEFFIHLKTRLKALHMIGQVLGLFIVGVGVWYLFTSGEAITKAKGDNLNIHVTNKKLRDTVAIKHPKFIKDSVIFTPLEKFEAQAADSFFNVLAVRSGFNGSALVAHEGKILYKRQFGFSDFTTKEMLNDTSEFQLGSVSKQFTAVSIMMLKEKGKLDYDDSIVKYFPDFPYKGVTIQMCLDHRSGIPNYMF
ncbi:MAG TPA: serine hydrolase domain-containing protein, partial [Bacteroidia bacterium]|nr:serine hydrolase domain-containing protein [Bacteroidia bacterium]